MTNSSAESENIAGEEYFAGMNIDTQTSRTVLFQAYQQEKQQKKRKKDKDLPSSSSKRAKGG